MKYIIPLMLLLASCGKISSWLGTSDSQNRSILSDVAIASVGTSTRGISDSSGNSNTCRGNPFEACRADGQKYCAAYVPPEPGQAPPQNLGQASFEERHQKMHAFMDCMKANLASLTSECQTVVQNAPQPPPEGERRKGPPPFKGQNGQGRPPHPPGGPGGGCRGQSLLGACVSDARTLCGTELPAQNEISPLSPDERRERVETILSCLSTQLASVSSECQAALKQIPVSE